MLATYKPQAGGALERRCRQAVTALAGDDTSQREERRPDCRYRKTGSPGRGRDPNAGDIPTSTARTWAGGSWSLSIRGAV